jgi:nicotinamide riboside transporter PnuC
VTHTELTAAAFGILGTLLLALNGRRAGWGFVAFLASNAAWILFAIDQQHLGLLVQHIVFSATSALGAYVWLVKPRRAAEPSDAGETHLQPGDIHTELLTAHARIHELETHLQCLTRPLAHPPQRKS